MPNPNTPIEDSLQGAQKATKYSDEEIITLIREASSALRERWYDKASSISANAAAQTALAMMTYNAMIDERWN